MKAREALRTHPNVKAGIDHFLKNFQLTGKDKVCSKDEYCRVFIKVGQILRPGIDIEDLQKIIREDFDSDSQEIKKANREEGEVEIDGGDQAPRSLDSLTSEKLEYALFELADTWCPNIDDGEYKEFFDVLDRKMQYTGQNDSSAYDVLT